MRRSGLADNQITPEDAVRAYDILSFRRDGGACSPPARLDLSAVMQTERLLELFERAREEVQQRRRGGPLAGLTEYRVGVELVHQAPIFGLTDVRRGGPNHAGREVDPSRTIVGTIHTHPWEVSQSIGDVRNLLRTNDLLGGVVTGRGHIFLLVKHPAALGQDRGPFVTELALQRASLAGTPELLRTVGLLGAVSAAFDLPHHPTRDPYIRSLAKQLGLVPYAGDVQTLIVQQG